MDGGNAGFAGAKTCPVPIARTGQSFAPPCCAGYPLRALRESAATHGVNPRAPPSQTGILIASRCTGFPVHHCFFSNASYTDSSLINVAASPNRVGRAVFFRSCPVDDASDVHGCINVAGGRQIFAPAISAFPPSKLRFLLRLKVQDVHPCTPVRCSRSSPLAVRCRERPREPALNEDGRRALIQELDSGFRRNDG